MNLEAGLISVSDGVLSHLHPGLEKYKVADVPEEFDELCEGDY